MNLEKMFEMQKVLQQKIGIDISSTQFRRLMFIGVITEACEAIEQTGWKPWKVSDELQMEEFQKEIIDLWHFVINLTISAGMSTGELYKMYAAKHEINLKRQEESY